MYPAPFDYERASSVEEAVSALEAADGRDVRPIAGGHGLLPAMKTGECAPDVLVDVGDCADLRGVTSFDSSGSTAGDAADGVVSPNSDDTVENADGPKNGGESGNGGGLRIGALTTHAEIAASSVVAEHVPALATAARSVGDVQVRTRGTVGGNLVEADPEADLPPVMVAAGATVRLRGPDGTREVAIGEFYDTADPIEIGDSELLTDVVVPDARTSAYVRLTHPVRGFAMIGVAAVIDVDDGSGEAVGISAKVTDARIAVGGVTPLPVRLSSVEDALVGLDIDGGGSLSEGDSTAIEIAAAMATDELESVECRGDVHASAEFRTSIVAPHVERAIETAIARHLGGSELPRRGSVGDTGADTSGGDAS